MPPGKRVWDNIPPRVRIPPPPPSQWVIANGNVPGTITLPPRQAYASILGMAKICFRLYVEELTLIIPENRILTFSS